MTYNTDLETIESLKQLQITINQLLTKSEERLSEAKQIQAAAEICQEKLEIITSIYKVIEEMGGKQELTEKIAKIEAANNFLNNCESQYENLSSGLKTAIDNINSLLTKEEEATKSMQENIIELRNLKATVVKESQLVQVAAKQTLQAITILGGEQGITKLITEANKLQHIYQMQISLQEKTSQELQQTKKLLQQFNHFINKEKQKSSQQIEQMQQTLYQSLQAIQDNQDRNNAKLQKLETKLLKIELAIISNNSQNE